MFIGKNAGNPKRTVIPEPKKLNQFYMALNYNPILDFPLEGIGQEQTATMHFSPENSQDEIRI